MCQYTVLRVGFASVCIQHCFHTTVLNRIFIAVEGVSGQTHYLAGLGDIAQLFGQIQQSNLVFDDSLVSIKDEGYLLCVLTDWFAPPSKPVTLSFSTTECQIWSELIQLIRRMLEQGRLSRHNVVHVAQWTHAVTHVIHVMPHGIHALDHGRCLLVNTVH